LSLSSQYFYVSDYYFLFIILINTYCSPVGAVSRRVTSKQSSFNTQGSTKRVQFLSHLQAKFRLSSHHTAHSKLTVL